jgi:hypothetical protein
MSAGHSSADLWCRSQARAIPPSRATRTALHPGNRLPRPSWALGSRGGPRLHAIQAATPVTTAAGVSAPHAGRVQALVHHLRVTWEALDTLEHARAPSAIPLAPWARRAQGRARSAPRGGSAPLAHHTPALPPPPHGHKRRGARPAPHAAARRPGGPGAARGPRVSGPQASRGPPQRSGLPAGRGWMTNRNATRGKRPRPPCALWPARGSVSSPGGGRIVPGRMRPSLSMRSTTGVLP